MKMPGLPLLLAGLCLFARPSGGATLVANPEAEAWGSPSFQGRPFWPVFPKMSHRDDGTNRPGDASSRGLEDLPLTQEYASLVETHSYKAGIAKYRACRGLDGVRDADGKNIYCTPIPGDERLAGRYTLRDAFGPGFGDYLYDGDWATRQLWNPKDGLPFFLSITESRPVFMLDGEDRGDKEDFARWRAAHPGFLGFKAMGEIDSDSGNYARAMKGTGGYGKMPDDIRRDLEARFPLWKDRYAFIDFIARCWETERRFHFGCADFWPLYCNNHTLAHINAKLGAVGLINEISASQGSPWTWSGAYTRGASRQWGIPFAWYCATFYRGFRRNQEPGTPPVAGDNKWPRDGKFSKKRPAYQGASLSLTARQKYYGWLIGASFIQDEPWTMLCATTENGVPGPSPYAKAFNDVFVRSRKIDRGAPYTPIALLTPISECVLRGGYVSALVDEDGYADDFLNLPAYLFTLQPVHEENGSYPMLQDRRRHGDEGCLFNSHFGEIWDVLVADSGQETPRFAAALAHYPAAFLIGSYRRGDIDVAALETYVRGGGTLFLSADYIDEGLVPATLAGVEIVEGRVASGESLIDERGSVVARLGGLYSLYNGAPASGTVPFLTDENGKVVAYARTLGKGRVVTAMCKRAMPSRYFKERYCSLDETHLSLRAQIISDKGDLDLIRYLLDRVQRETIPIQVDGDIQWGLGKNDKGWLLWLINNKGIAKFVGEPADVDATKTADVRISLGRLVGAIPCNADTGAELPVSDGCFSVKVGAGDVAFVQISTASPCVAAALPCTDKDPVDLVIYGSTPAGISAAIQARRMGMNAVVVSPESRIGGMTTGGLGQTDVGDTAAHGGISRQFYRDVRSHYADESNWVYGPSRDEYDWNGRVFPRDSDTMWMFEPSVALKILERWERAEGLRIVRGARLDRRPGGVKVEGGRIVSIRTEDGRVWRGRMFIDATYEGDMMAAAGVSYTVGRESNSLYGETLNGVQPNQGYHKLAKGVDPYAVKGDPSSGLLPGIDPAPMEEEGTGDRRVQAYNFRLCLTDIPANRIPFEKPVGYDERDYEIFFRNYEAGEPAPPVPWIHSVLPNRKTDTNNRKGFSSDFIGQSHSWAEASYEERERIFAAHRKYQMGLFWTMANHPRTPKAIRDVVSQWGLCKDEFAETGGWPSQLYVREARRMVGEYVMTEMDCRRQREAPNPVALGAYKMDSHHVRRYVGADGFVQNEGDVEVNCVAGPYGIAYGSIVPKRGECGNLLVPVCISATHIAYGSIRMEPVFFALGQAAGTAAALALEANCAVQDVDYVRLRERLVADGQCVDSVNLVK